LNFIGHILLSPDNDLVQLGNFLGYFVKPSQYYKYHKEIIRGIELHKQIDHLTDSNTYFKESVSILREGTGKYASVVFDILLDHVIINKMPNYSLADLRKTSDHFFSVVQKHRDLIPESANRFLQYAQREDVFYGYADLNRVKTVLNHMDHRSKYPSSMQNGVSVFIENEQDLVTKMWDCFMFVKENLEEDGWL
jgi:acyl carrier protein phosphodiesterase